MPPKKPSCGNPLWLSWVQELRDEAMAKQKKSYESYQRACMSIEACPVPYAKPRDLICLRGVGDQTIKILETRWDKWLIEHPEDARNRGPLVGPSPAKTSTNAKASSSKRPKAMSKAQQAKEGLSSDSELEYSDPSLFPVPKKKRKPATYIPAPRSGGYGILMALVLAIEEPWRTTTVFQSRDEIVRVAQKWCNSSYDKGEKNAWMTAWNSVKTLVNRGYVYERGRPANFCLTEEGYNVAVTIRNLAVPEKAAEPQYPFKDTDDPEPRPFNISDQEDDEPVQAMSLPFPQAAPKKTYVDPLEALRGVVGRTNSSGSRAHLDVHAQAAMLPPPPKKARTSSGMFGFWYLDPAGNHVKSLNDAFIKLDPDTFTITRKLAFEPAQLSHPFVKQLKNVELDESDGIYTAFIEEDNAPPQCSGFLPTANTSPTVVAAPRAAEPVREMGFLDQMARFSDPSSSFSRTASAPLPPPVASSSKAAAAAMTAAGPAPSTFSRSVSASSAAVPKPRAGPRMSSHREAPSALFQYDPLTPSLPTAALQPSDFQPEDAIIYPPGSYEILLVLDSREDENFYGRERCSDLLRARKVKVDVRALRIGDMCWVARRIDGGVGGEQDECVLDYIVERKRLDDLLSSLTDGRYHEQKFRLAQSCISRVYYIVEDWQKVSSGKSDKFGPLQINTAKSQTSIIDGFFVKETHRFTETLDYLATLSEVIIEECRGKALHVIPPRYISRSSFPALQARLRASNPDKSFLTTYDAFQTLNDKTASRTLKERFGRMLLCIKGLSAEKVGAMLEKWDTPRALYESLKRRIEEEPAEKPSSKKHRGPELFFADQFAGEGRRKIGDALSRELFKVFMD